MLELLELHRRRQARQFPQAAILTSEAAQKLLNTLLVGVGGVMLILLIASYLVPGFMQGTPATLLPLTVAVIVVEVVIFLIGRYRSQSQASALFLALLVGLIPLTNPGGVLFQNYRFLLFAIPIIISSILLSAQATHFVMVGSCIVVIAAAWPHVLTALPTAAAIWIMTLLNYQIDQGWHSVIQRFYISNQRLAESEQRYRNLLAAIASVLIGTDEHNHIIQWNGAAEKLFGILAAQATQQTLDRCGVEWEQAKIAEGVAQCQACRAPVRQERVAYKRPDGKWSLLGLVFNPILREDRTCAGVLIVGADISGRLQLESQLSQAQKLKSIGQLAAGIAHEINTPTQYVGDNTRFLRDSFASVTKLLGKYRQFFEAVQCGAASPAQLTEVEAAIQEADVDYLVTEIPQALQQSLEGIDRISKIVGAMKEFSHPGGENKQAINLNRAIENTLTVARNEWKYVADVTTNFDEDLPLVNCLPSELNQVFLNLLVNAAHAIADTPAGQSGSKGLITLSTRRQGAWVEVRVQDTGTGIPTEIQDRIFDPFFTTKEVGRGTGQGLSIAHAVVAEKHGGALTFETEIGRGTTFIIRLPLAEPPAPD